jgi:hypothetical protein
MKVFVILFASAWFANAIVPPFDSLLSGGLGSILGGLNPLGATATEDDDQQNTVNTGQRFGGIFGGQPRQIAGDVLGVKVNLLTALRNTIIGEETIDLEGSTAGASVDGTGVGISGFESSGGASEVSSQAFSAGSAFASMGNTAGEFSGGQSSASGGFSAGQSSASGAFSQSSAQESSGGYSNSQNNLSPPATSYGVPDVGNGQAGGYNYERPPPVDGNGYNYQRPSAPPQNSYNPPSNGNNGYNYQRPSSPPQNSYIPPTNPTNGGYNYPRPSPPQNTYIPASTGNGNAANGGYNYERPPPIQPPPPAYGPPSQPQNTYGPPSGNFASQSSSFGSASELNSFDSSSGSSSQSEQPSIGLSNSRFDGGVSISEIGASEFSSGSSSTSQSQFSGIQATQSDSAGLSASVNVGASGSRSNQGLQGIANSVIRSGVQAPITLLTNYRTGVNRGFDTLARGLDSLQRIFSGGNSESSDVVESDSRLDSPPSASFDFSSNDVRRRFFK